MIVKVIEKLYYGKNEIPDTKEIVIGNIKSYTLQQGTLNYVTNDNQEDGLFLEEYTTEDFSLGDNPPKVTHKIVGAYLMNDRGQTIDKLID